MVKTADKPPARAILTAIAGPNQGDSVSIELGTCRLIGRHLCDNETAFIDRDGNRVLDGSAASILERHLRDRTPPHTEEAPRFVSEVFARGADIIFSDDSISRAHAMIFHDTSGCGIIDLASTNGTFVNDERITTTAIGPGDVITLGNSELRVAISS